MYGRLITMMVFVLLGLMAMAFAFNYLWYRVFGMFGARPPQMPQQTQQVQAEAIEAENELEEQRRARIKADQEKKAQLAEKHKKELPSKRAAWKAKEEARSAEEKAQADLKMALDLLQAERRDAAHRRFRDIIEKYPGTDAAAEAERRLKQ